MKISKHNFGIAVDPKRPPSGTTFWSGLEAPDHKGRVWWPRPFPAKNEPKNEN